MILVDTHTHLFLSDFEQDRDEAVLRSINAGVEYLMIPNIDSKSIDPLYELCEQFSAHCFPMMGLHPGSVDSTWKDQLTAIEQHLFTKKNIAVGEIGMDLYWDKSFLKEQAQAFETQIAWAKELELPIVIHAREAFDEIFSILDRLNDDRLTGIFHCFTGNIEQAKKIQLYGGFKIGIGGVLTYKKSGLDEVVKEIPMELIVLETDSPYLPPTPHRGKRNESAYLVHIAEKLSEIKGLKLTELAEITTFNALEVFKLGKE